MDFSGPEPADFTNVMALNKAFLKYLCRTDSGRNLRRMLSSEIEPLVAALTATQISRLSEAPFLLFSLREFDDACWRELFAHDPNGDLFRVEELPSDECGQIIAAALGFLWRLSSSNPYSARVVSDATLSWCERLAETTLLRLIRCSARRSDLLIPRLADNDDLWRKLLVAGISSEPLVRAAAQQCALQTLLTGAHSSNYQSLPAAACRLPVQVLQVAEATDKTEKPSGRKKL
jgi:hypothetical protein